MDYGEIPVYERSDRLFYELSIKSLITETLS